MNRPMPLLARDDACGGGSATAASDQNTDGERWIGQKVSPTREHREDQEYSESSSRGLEMRRHP